jgi:photosynthetic reaction center cytochrome c subunit
MSHRFPAAARLALAGLLLVLGACERPSPLVVQRGYRGVAMEENRNPRLLARLVAANEAPALIPPIPGDQPKAADVYQNVQVLKDLSLPEFTRVMLAITAWVAPPDKSCSYCHQGPMADDALYTKKVARRMLAMVRDINSNWQAHVGSTGVTCYTCHRGQPVPAQVWFAAAPVARPQGMLGDRAGQNAPSPVVGLSSLPNDPFSSFLLEARSIRVGSATALPTGDRASIKQTEWTYGFMMHISQALGVNCTYCHNSRAFRDWDQSHPARATAWHGIQMVRALNTEYLRPLTDTFPDSRHGPLGDVAKVNCATCHQGVYKPLFGAQMAKDYPELQHEKVMEPAAAPPATPAAAATPPAKSP